MNFKNNSIFLLSKGNVKELYATDLICADFNATTAEYVKLYGNWHYGFLFLTLYLDYFGHSLLVNPIHRLIEVLPKNFFQIIFHHFFRLKQEYQKQVIFWKLTPQIDDFKTKYFGEYTIAIQIRYWAIRDAVGTLDSRYPMTPLAVYTQAAYQLSHFSEVPYDKVVWFVATQNRDFVEQMRFKIWNCSDFKEHFWSSENSIFRRWNLSLVGSNKQFWINRILDLVFDWRVWWRHYFGVF